MSEAGDTSDQRAIERELRQVIAKLDRASPDTGRTAMDAEPALERVRRRLDWEWRRRLLVERNGNSEAQELSTAERYAREAALFDGALADLLPLGSLLSEAERRGRGSPDTSGLEHDAADGLHALAAADLDGALEAWSGSVDVAAMAVAVREQRETFAQALLQQAAAHFAQAAALSRDAERAQLRAVLHADYLEPARRVGTEQQRDRARQLGAAFDLLLVPASPAPSVPASKRPLAATGPVVAPPRAVPSRLLPLAFALAGLAAALLALIVWLLPDLGRDGGGTTANPITWSTPETVAVIELTPLPTQQPTQQPTDRPTATPRPTPRPTATRTPSPDVVSVEPAELFVGALPAELRVRGADLDRVQSAQLLPEGKPPIALELAGGNQVELVLRLAALPEAIAGAVSAVLAIDGEITETPPIVLRDFKATRIVAGVRKDYAYTDRIMSDGAGAYTTIHQSSNVATAALAPLRNGEQIEVLRDDVSGWYGVRIRIANDPRQTGKAGWVERWLVDDAGAPKAEAQLQAVAAARVTDIPQPAPRPQPTLTPTTRPKPTARPTPRPAPPARRSFAAEVVSSFPESGSSGGRDSCVQGVVRARNGSGVGAAAVATNNGNAETGTLTNEAGEYQICGLGDSTWSVLLRYVPGKATLAREAVATVYVDGSSVQVAVVNFVER